MSSSLELLQGPAEQLLDAFLDVPAVMCARAGSRRLCAKYSPPNKAKWWAAAGICAHRRPPHTNYSLNRFGKQANPAKFCFYRTLQEGGLSPQGATFLRGVWGIRFRNVRALTHEIVREAIETGDVKVADWFFKEFGAAAAYELGTAHDDTADEKGTYVSIPDRIRAAIDGGKLEAAGWMLRTFEVDFEKQFREAFDRSLATGNLKTLLWLEEQHKRLDYALVIDTAAVLKSHHCGVVEHMVKTYRLLGWASSSISLWAAILEHIEADRTSVALCLLRYCGREPAPYRATMLAQALKASGRSTGRDGAKLRKELCTLLGSAPKAATQHKERETPGHVQPGAEPGGATCAEHAGEWPERRLPRVEN